MKTKNLKSFATATLLVALLSLQAEARKITSPIVHGVPWIETRLTYTVTVTELAQNYYGNVEEVDKIMKANKFIKSADELLHKDMVIHIPVTKSFRDQPEYLGWEMIQG
ncbi:MAG TPA: hypothetical protein ENK82_04890 [Campylobacterales bacterium]|nr:hypothetical protein [Campylobacterales bacterium]HHS92661.1 hypothetical protein [Campylobacterales bacterium]